jgi:hypothetical protein
MRAKINQGLLYKQFAESGKAQAVITLEANQRSVEQCLEKGLPTQPLRLRLIRVGLEDGEVEVLITNLMDEQAFPAGEFKELYHLRWGAEIYQSCCLRKSVYKKLMDFIHGLMYPDTLNAPLLA